MMKGQPCLPNMSQNVSRKWSVSESIVRITNEFSTCSIWKTIQMLYFWLNANVSKLLEKLSTLRNLPNKMNEFLCIFLEKADIHLTICYLYLFYIVDIFSIFSFCLHQSLCLCYRFFLLFFYFLLL